MPSAHLIVETPIKHSARVMQLRGLFDLPEAKTSRLEWDVRLPIEEREWSIGLIVGPSGCGKSTIARELWPEQLAAEHQWPQDRSLIDAFPADMPIKDIVELLSAVGFSSPPSWLRPFERLSNGEQFRVTIARTLAECEGLAVIDEFTSVVDRTVAQIGSAAIARTVRRRGKRLIAVTCHEDVEAWLQPDWIYRPATVEFTWGCLQRRPDVELTVARVHTSYWRLFRHHHYLDTNLHRGAVCFAAFLAQQPVAFSAWLPTIGIAGMRREHRTVCLPDYQGIGIGNRLSAFCASIWKGVGYRVTSATSHPGMIGARNRSDQWAMIRRPSRTSARDANLVTRRASRRLTASFEYVGPALARAEARRLLHGL